MRPIYKFVAAGTVLALFGTTSVIADGHGASAAEKAVAARHHQMQMVGYHIGMLGAIAKGEMDYSAEIVDAAAKNLAGLAQMQKATLWIEETEQGAVEGSRAKAEIWQNMDDFAAKFTALEEASLALVGAADAGAVGAGMGALGGSCKGCHEKYRGPKDE